jgi:chromate transporter
MTETGPHPSESNVVPVSLSRLLVYFLRLGTTGFGGPIALVGYMQKDLVEERRWYSQQDYLQGLAFSQLSPGPLAAQLAIYLGWLRAGPLGATLTGVAFIVPSFLMVMVPVILAHLGSRMPQESTSRFGFQSWFGLFCRRFG